MNVCRDCAYLKETRVNTQCSYLECVRPQGDGNRKAHPDVGGCEYFREAMKNGGEAKS